MAIRIVQLGSPRIRGEGLRIGTVRRPPRGVPKAEYADRNFYDQWLPQIAPSADAIDRLRQSANADAAWRRFEKRYTAEMNRPDNRRLLELLAAQSHHVNFSVGCYCENEDRCHRSVLRQILRSHGARLE